MNPYLNPRYCDIRATFQLIDLTAKPDATPSALSGAPISQIAQTIDNVHSQTYKLATLENNYLSLDGTFTFANPDVSGAQTGWWSSEISDSTGVINTSIEFNFTKDHDSYGLTLIFDDKTGEYPREFNVKAYNSFNMKIVDMNVINDDVECAIVTLMENYRKIVITFTKTNNPFRRIRLTEIIFGVIEKFTKKNTKELVITKELSPSSNALPISEVDITFDNSSKKYNMLSPTGVYKYLQTGLPMTVEIGIGATKESVEYETIGTFYYLNSQSEDDSLTARITAQDAIMYFDNIKYIPSAGTTTTLKSVASQMNISTGLNLIYTIDQTIADIALANLETTANTSCREALKQACQAAKAACFVDKAGHVIIKRLAKSTSADTLDGNKMQAVPKITTAERITTYETKNNEIVGVYTSKEATEIDQKKSTSNSFLTQALANSVAQWLLENTRMYKYEIVARGNPLRELGQTVTVNDAFNVNRPAIITKHILTYDGGLTEKINCVGEER